MISSTVALFSYDSQTLCSDCLADLLGEDYREDECVKKISARKVREEELFCEECSQEEIEDSEEEEIEEEEDPFSEDLEEEGFTLNLKQFQFSKKEIEEARKARALAKEQAEKETFGEEEEEEE